MGEFADRLKSRKFLLAAGTFALAVLTDIFGVSISPDTWNVILTTVIGFIAVEGAADVAERIKKE